MSLANAVHNLIVKSFKEVDKNILQNKIYLLSTLNVNLGYGFIWYLKGPYSPELGEVLHESLMNKENVDLNLKQEVTDKIKMINNLKTFKPVNLDDKMWYRLLASMIFIEINQYMWKVRWPNYSPQEILRFEMPIYTKDDCIAAQKTLVNMQMINKNKE